MRWVDELGLKAIHGVGGTWNTVTSGRGQPTMTIQALAFRAAEHTVDAARRGEI